MPGDIDYHDFIEDRWEWASRQLREDYWDYFGNRWDYDDWDYNEPEVDDVDEEAYEVPIKRGVLREKKQRKLRRIAAVLCLVSGLCVFGPLTIVGLIINNPVITVFGEAMTEFALLIFAPAFAIYAIIYAISRWRSNRTEGNQKQRSVD
jgi:hypothetical protein